MTPPSPAANRSSSRVARWSRVCIAQVIAALGILHAQTAPPPVPRAFQLTIDPPPGTIMITQTVNQVSVTIGNFSSFTNVNVTVRVSNQVTTLLDDGLPPDDATNDGTFRADLLVPAFPAAGPFDATYIATGNDLAITNDAGDLDTSILASTTNVVSYWAVIRPPNDKFVDAFKIPSPGALILYTNDYASLEPGEPLHADVAGVEHSVWWFWSPSVSTNVLVDLAGSAFDPVLAVYKGTAVDQLTKVAASTNIGMYKPYVTFDVESGATYRIAVSSYEFNNFGDVRLRIAPGWTPDLFGPAVTIISPGAESLFTNQVVTFAGNAKDLLPHPSEVAQVFLRVNQQPEVVALGTTNWTADIALLPGTNVVRAVAQDYAGNRGLPHLIVVRYADPINDNFTEALPLSNLGDRLEISTRLATREPGEPLHALNEGGHSVWWSFRPIVNGSFTATTLGSDFDTLLAVYTGTDLTNLVEVAANDDAFIESGYSTLATPLSANTTYYIVVDGYGDENGNAVLDYSFTTTEIYYSLDIIESLGGDVFPPAGLYFAGTNLSLIAVPGRDFEFVSWGGTILSTSNPFPLVMDQNHRIIANFRVKSLTEGFESGDFSALPWTVDAKPWQIDSSVARGGRFSARSGSIADNQKSTLTLDIELTSGTGTFDVRTSSELGWDRLEFYYDDVLLRMWSGEKDWESFQFPVTEGRHSLKWTYSKDANFSRGLDAAFLDNVYLPLADQALASVVSISDLGAGSVRVSSRGVGGRTYVIERSPDLPGLWQPVFTNATVNGAFYWDDTTSTNAVRFYRAVAQ